MKLLFADLRSKRKTWWVPHEINHVSSVTKHLFSVVCFKSRSNYRNKHPLQIMNKSNMQVMLARSKEMDLLGIERRCQKERKGN
jgi:hypothetical protein